MVSNIISILTQYFVVGGWGSLVKARVGATPGRDKDLRQRIAQVEGPSSRITAGEADITDSTADEEEEPSIGRGGYSTGISRVKHQPKRGKGQHPRGR